MPAKTKSTEASHPKYIDMVKAALKNIKDRKGISRPAIFKYVVATYKLPAEKARSHVNTALKRGVESGALKQDGQRFRTATSTKDAPKKKTVKKAIKKSSVTLKKAAAKGKPIAKKPSTKKTVKKATKPKKVAEKKAAA